MFVVQEFRRAISTKNFNDKEVAQGIYLRGRLTERSQSILSDILATLKAISAYNYFSMQEEKTIVTIAITGSVTPHGRISKNEILLQSKKNELSEFVMQGFTFTRPSVFIEHLNFLQNFFQENYDHETKGYSKEFLEDNLAFVNQLKLDLVKQFELTNEIDFIEERIELLTSKQLRDERTN